MEVLRCDDEDCDSRTFYREETYNVTRVENNEYDEFGEYVENNDSEDEDSEMTDDSGFRCSECDTLAHFVPSTPDKKRKTKWKDKIGD